MKQPVDTNGRVVRVGSRVKVTTLSEQFLATLPSDEVDDVRSMIGDAFEVYDIDEYGGVWVMKEWNYPARGESMSHAVSLTSSEMELVEPASKRSARTLKMLKPLSPALMHRCVRKILPARNGYLPVDFDSLIVEAERFGVANLREFRKLLLKHRRTLAEEDYYALMDPVYVQMLMEDLGAAAVAQMRRKQRCFGWEALVRFAYEREFGDSYEAFSRERDRPGKSENDAL